MLESDFESDGSLATLKIEIFVIYFLFVARQLNGVSHVNRPNSRILWRALLGSRKVATLAQIPTHPSWRVLKH
jgi:hypothetical protein